MTGRATVLPYTMVAVIVLFVLIAISTGRSDAPELEANRNYPHHVCTFTEYCIGDTCTRDPLSFIVYLQHVDGQPRIELDGFAPRASMSTSGSSMMFETRGGEFEGVFTLLANRRIDVTAQSQTGEAVLDYFATGTCERLQSP